jgi:phytoene dehydrogenase-like protein
MLTMMQIGAGDTATPRRRPTADRFRTLEHDAYDVVIIGAGSGGLTAGALLARRGRSVLVLDQHYVAGGNGTVFRRPGYEFDVGLHYLGDCGPDGLIPKILRAAGAPVRFRELDPDGFDTMRFGDFEFRVPRGLSRFRQRLVDAFPGEQRGIDRYVKLLRQMWALTQITGPRSALLTLPRVSFALRWSTSTLGEFLDTCTQHARLRAVLAGQHVTYAQPPSRVALPLHAIVAMHYFQGAYYPEGGGQVIADRLAATIEAHGGKILLRARAHRIVVEDGRAVGVEFENRHVGRRSVRAAAVISNADLKHTLCELVGVERLPAATVRRVADYEMSPGLAVVYLGVRRDLRATGVRNTNYHVFSDTDHETVYAEAAAGRFHAKPPCYVSLTSMKDPDNPRIAPPGIANIQLMTVVPSSPEAWGTSAVDVVSGTYRRSEGYQWAKRELATRLIEQAERVLPGLRGDIVYQEVATPVTHSRFTGSSGGTSYGLAMTPQQFLHRRPGSGTDIKGLYLCGASTRTAHGIAGTMLSGVLAAAKVVGMGLMAEVLAPAHRTSGEGRG